MYDWRDRYDAWKLDNREDEDEIRSSREQEAEDAEIRAELRAEQLWEERTGRAYHGVELR